MLEQIPFEHALAAARAGCRISHPSWHGLYARIVGNSFVRFGEDGTEFAWSPSFEEIMSSSWRILDHYVPPPPSGPTPSEAVTGFAAWMTTLTPPVSIGSSEECGPVVELVGRFLSEHGFPGCRDGYERVLDACRTRTLDLHSLAACAAQLNETV